jgi:hypothetical protein
MSRSAGAKSRRKPDKTRAEPIPNSYSRSGSHWDMERFQNGFTGFDDVPQRSQAGRAENFSDGGTGALHGHAAGQLLERFPNSDQQCDLRTAHVVHPRQIHNEARSWQTLKLTQDLIANLAHIAPLPLINERMQSENCIGAMVIELIWGFERLHRFNSRERKVKFRRYASKGRKIAIEEP